MGKVNGLRPAGLRPGYDRPLCKGEKGWRPRETTTSDPPPTITRVVYPTLEDLDESWLKGNM